MTTDKKLYSLREAAKVVDYSMDVLKQEIAKGTLKAKRRANEETGEPTGAYRITPKALDDWIESLGDA